VAIVTSDSTRSLGLRPGQPAMALIQATSVVLATGLAGARVSARNQLPGVVRAISPGAVNTEVLLDLDAGQPLVAMVSEVGARALELAPGARVLAEARCGGAGHLDAAAAPGGGALAAGSGGCIAGRALADAAQRAREGALLGAISRALITRRLAAPADARARARAQTAPPQRAALRRAAAKPLRAATTRASPGCAPSHASASSSAAAPPLSTASKAAAAAADEARAAAAASASAAPPGDAASASMRSALSAAARREARAKRSPSRACQRLRSAREMSHEPQSSLLYCACAAALRRMRRRGVVRWRGRLHGLGKRRVLALQRRHPSAARTHLQIYSSSSGEKGRPPGARLRPDMTRLDMERRMRVGASSGAAKRLAESTQAESHPRPR
jgi:molybdopterin-binding protein